MSLRWYVYVIYISNSWVMKTIILNKLTFKDTKLKITTDTSRESRECPVLLDWGHVVTTRDSTVRSSPPTPVLGAYRSPNRVSLSTSLTRPYLVVGFDHFKPRLAGEKEQKKKLILRGRRPEKRGGEHPYVDRDSYTQDLRRRSRVRSTLLVNNRRNGFSNRYSSDGGRRKKYMCASVSVFVCEYVTVCDCVCVCYVSVYVYVCEWCICVMWMYVCVCGVRCTWVCNCVCVMWVYVCECGVCVLCECTCESLWCVCVVGMTVCDVSVFVCSVCVLCECTCMCMRVWEVCVSVGVCVVCTTVYVCYVSVCVSVVYVWVYEYMRVYESLWCVCKCVSVRVYVVCVCGVCV